MDEDKPAEGSSSDVQEAAPSFSRKKSTRISIKRDDKLRRTLKSRAGSTDSPDRARSASDIAATNNNEEQDKIANRNSAPADVTKASSNQNGLSVSDTEKTEEVPSTKEQGDMDSGEQTSELNETLYSWGSTFASFMGVVGKHAMDGALTVMAKTLQYVPEYSGDLDEEDDDDAIDQWHDAFYAESESDSDVEFEDAVEQIAPRDRIHNICNELMTTEQAYVKRLAILVTAKERVGKMLGDDVAKSMFKDIETIHQFHSDYLLPQLQERLQFWEKYKRIGDIMKRFTPFLKLYTEYVKNFESASALVEHYDEKSNKFASFHKEIKEGAQYGRLRIQAHMLEPVQRVPRYELLLRDYLKRLDADSPDRPDTEKAMELVSQAASHFENMMKRDSRIGEMVQLQRQMDGAVNLVGASREMCKKGKLHTLGTKSSKKGEKIAFLFTDLLVICTEQVLGGTKYKVKHNLELSEAQIADGNNLDYPHTFYIKTTDKVVELCFNSLEEKMEWEEAILKQMKESTKTKLIRSGSTRLKEPSDGVQTLGKQAPVPVRQSSATMCMLCAAEFTTLRRKRNCRACGIIVCGKCSQHTAMLEYDRSKPLRVCDECFVLLKEDSRGRAGSVPGSPGPGGEGSSRMKTKGECFIKGFLQYSSDNGKTWKKRWFALHDSATLYSFKAPQDISPLTSMTLEGYNVEVKESSSPKKGSTIIQLQGMGKTYLLHDEDKDNIQRWYTLMAGDEEKQEEKQEDKQEEKQEENQEENQKEKQEEEVETSEEQSADPSNPNEEGVNQGADDSSKEGATVGASEGGSAES